MRLGQRFESARRLFFLAFAGNMRVRTKGSASASATRRKTLPATCAEAWVTVRMLMEVEQHETDEQSHDYDEQVNDERPNSDLFPPPTR
jgi:hypothetical protein